MTETRTREAVRLVATIHQNFDNGRWYVRGSGSGLVREFWLESPLYAERILSSLVANGYEIADPEHYCDLYGVLAGPLSQSADNRDAAEAPDPVRLSAIRGDNGSNIWPEAEILFQEGEDD